MLYMVIERFKNVDLVRERFQQRGRLFAEGLNYLGSWIEAESGRCFQLMESPNRDSLEPWMDQWRDLVNFEVVPVIESAEYWQAWDQAAQRQAARGG